MATDCVAGVGAALAADKWYRIKTSKTEFEPHISYQFHPEFSDECTTYSCSEGKYVTTLCHSLEDTLLWDKTVRGNVERYLPDIVPDLRDLKNVKRECVWEGAVNGQIPPLIVGLRLPRPLANAGISYLQIESPVAGSPCSDSFDCPAGLFCDSGTCTYRTDCTSIPCPDGLVCDSGTCALTECSNLQPCAFGPGCIYDGLCEPMSLPSSHGEQPCINDQSCDPNQECRWNGSYSACFQRTCEDHLDCPSGYCWLNEGLCVPTPASCNEMSTDCDCNLGDSGTCAPGVFQVFRGLLGTEMWREEVDLDISFNQERDQWEIDDIAIHSVYQRKTACNATPHNQRNSSWWATCGVGLNTGPTTPESLCLDARLDFDDEISDAGYGFDLLNVSASCGPVHRVSTGKKSVSDEVTQGHFLVLDDRRVNSTFQNLLNLSNKNIWVELTFDPESKTIERSKANNTSRVSLALPYFPGIATVNWMTYCDSMLGCDSMEAPCSDYF